MHHRIRFVSDEDMPDGHDFVFVHAGDEHMIFYRESAVTPCLLEESWRAYRALLATDESRRRWLQSVS